MAQPPPRARLAKALRYIGDLPEAEITKVMGISRGTVASTAWKRIPTGSVAWISDVKWA